MYAYEIAGNRRPKIFNYYFRCVLGRLRAGETQQWYQSPLYALYISCYMCLWIKYMRFV